VAVEATEPLSSVEVEDPADDVSPPVAAPAVPEVREAWKFSMRTAALTALRMA